MKALPKRLILIWCLLIMGAALVTSLHFFHRKEEVGEEIIGEEGKYRIGEINIDTSGKGQIKFTGTISKGEGRVQFLIYLKGYKWLREESAIISEARLIELQQAIALLDWRLWDELWYRRTEDRRQRTEDRRQRTEDRSQRTEDRSQRTEDRSQRTEVRSQRTEDRSQRTEDRSQRTEVRGQRIEDRKLLVSVKWDEEEIAASKLVLTKDKLEIGDFIFLGSPYFDQIALQNPPGMDCRLCPIFPLEEKALREGFIRESGQSGYELNSPLFPPRGTKVTIVIRDKDYTER